MASFRSSAAIPAETQSLAKTSSPDLSRHATKLELLRNRLEDAAGDDAVDHSVTERLLGLHDVVAVDVAGDAVNGLASCVGENVVQSLAHAQDFLGVDVDIGGLA